jgi:hypothetical protein
MKVKLTIDVRRTNLSIARLSTSACIRAPLVRIADRVFSELGTEPGAQGITLEVDAERFGLALHLSPESRSCCSRSSW